MTAEDSHGGTSTADIGVTVEDYNEAPPSGRFFVSNTSPIDIAPPYVLTWTTVSHHSQAQPFQSTTYDWGPIDLKTYFSDPDGQPSDLRFSVVGGSLPTGMTLSSEGIIGGTYDSYTDGGSWRTEIEISDGPQGAANSRSIRTAMVTEIQHTDADVQGGYPEVEPDWTDLLTIPGGVFDRVDSIAVNESIALSDGEKVVYTGDRSHDGGATVSVFTEVTGPSNGVVFDLIGPQSPMISDRGSYTYTPAVDGEGLDSFSFKLENPFFVDPIGYADPSIWLASTTAEAYQYIEVGQAIRTDIDINLPEFSPDAAQETSSWHTYDADADLPDDFVAYVGYQERVPLSLGYWLRDDAYTADFTAHLTVSSPPSVGGTVTFWDAEEGGSELFAVENGGGTEWILGDEEDDLPSQIWVQGASGGFVDVTLDISGPQTALFTDIVAPSDSTADTDDTDTIYLFVGPGLELVVDTDAPDCSCECSCSTSPTGGVDSNSGDASASAPATAGESASYASPEKNAPTGRVTFTSEDTDGGDPSVYLYLHAPGSDPTNPDPLPTQFDPIDLGDLSGATGDGIHAAFFEPDLYGVDPGYYLGYLDLGAKAAPTIADFRANSWTPIVHHGDYGFGDGWNIAGIERIVARPDDPTLDDIYWVRADNEILTFTDLGHEDTLTRVADNDRNRTVITADGSGGFLLTDKYNNRTYFNADGWITERVDPYGNRRTYTYTGGGPYRIEQVEDSINGQVTTFHWNGDKITEIEDFAGRRTVLEYGVGAEADYLKRIELPDPEGVATAGGGPANVFAYDSEGRLVGFTDADQVATSFAYSLDGQVIDVTYGDGSSDAATTRLTIPEIPFLTDGLEWKVFSIDALPEQLTKSSLTGADLTLAARTGSFIDKLGRVTTFEVDGNGYVTEATDPTGRRVASPRNSVGQPTATLTYDAEGALVDSVDYTYDANNNLASVTYADQTSVSSTYDSHSRLLEYTDELGRVVTIDYHTADEWAPGAAKQVTTRVVIGQDDTQSSESDDLVTVAPFLANGLIDYTVAQRIDNDGTPLDDIKTHFEYTDPSTDVAGDPDDLILLKSIATVVNGATLAYVKTKYDDHGNATEVSQAVDIVGAADIDSAETDDVLRTTAYEYDRLNRVTKITSPDPGAGQAAPVLRLEYNQINLVTNQIESYVGAQAADEIVTHYAYDGRHRVVEQTYNYDTAAAPDHETNVKVTYAYDDASNLTSITDPLGRVTAFDYDLLDRTVRVTAPDPDGGEPLAPPVSHIAYDALGRLLAERDPNGNVTRYAYDQRHRVTDILSPLGVTTSLAYDDAGQVTAATDPEGRTATYAYDDAGRLTSLTLPGQMMAMTYEYDTLSNTRVVTDQLGRETRFEYDDQSRLERTIANYQDGLPSAAVDEDLTTTYAYNDDGLVQSVTELIGWDASGGGSEITRTTSYAYDGAGRLATVTLPSATHVTGAASPELHYRYDGFGNLRFEVDPLGLVTEYAYDKLHRTTSVLGEDPDGASVRYDDATGAIAAADAGGATTTYAYDAASQLASVTDPLARTSAYDYDLLGRLVRTVAPDPADGSEWTAAADPTVADGVPFTRYEYDAAGNLTATHELNDAGAFIGMTYTYDSLHRPLTETDAEGGVTRYAYDRASNLLSLTDPAGNTTSWVYDDLNRVTTETNELGASRLYAYDMLSRLTQKTDRNGRVTTYDYDGVNRPTAEHWYADAADPTADHTISYTYDHAGRLLSSGDTFHDYTFTYDDLDRLAGRTVGITGLTPDVDFTRSYDVAGRPFSVEASFDTGAATAGDYANFYRYDHLHRPTGITQVSAGSAPGDHEVANKHVEFDYDLAGQLETVTRFTETTLGAPGFVGTAGTEVTTTAYAYDGAGRLATIEHFDGADTDPATGALLAGYGYTFDHRSRLEAIDFLPGNAGYTSAFDYSSEDVTYNYDEKQQLEGADYAGAANDEAYQYDANGNRTDGGFVAGADNRLDTDGTYTYTYDPEGNITRRDSVADNSYTVYDWDHRNRLIRVTDYDDQGAEASRVEYAYDAGDDLIRRRVFLSGGATPSESQVFVYDGGQAVLELDDDSGAADLDAEDLAHRYLWGPGVNHLLVDEAVASLTDASLNERRWALNDHLGTIRDWAADDGSVLDHAEYDSYGQRLDTPVVESSIAWTGAYRDPLTGLQRHGKRWYNPETARWMSQDWIKDGKNWHAYAGNSPTTYVDTNGLQTMVPLRGPVEIDGVTLTEVPAINGQPDLSPWEIEGVDIISVGEHGFDRAQALELLEDADFIYDSDLHRLHHHVIGEVVDCDGRQVVKVRMQVVPKKLHTAVSHVGGRKLAERFYKRAGTDIARLKEWVKQAHRNGVKSERAIRTLRYFAVIGTALRIYSFGSNVQAHGLLEGSARSAPLLGDLIQIGEDSAAIHSALRDIEKLKGLNQRQLAAITRAYDHASTSWAARHMNEIAGTICVPYGYLTDSDIADISDLLKRHRDRIRALYPANGADPGRPPSREAIESLRGMLREELEGLFPQPAPTTPTYLG